MYHKLIYSLYDGKLEPQDRYIAIGDLVLTLFNSKNLGPEANPLGRYLFTKSTSEELTIVYQKKREQDIMDKNEDGFSFSSTTLGQSPALETTHLEYSPSDTVSETTPSPKAKDLPNQKKNDKRTTITATASSSSKTAASRTQSDGTSTPSYAFSSFCTFDKTPRKLFESAEATPNPFTAFAAVMKQTKPDQPKKQGLRSFFSNFGRFGSLKPTSFNEQPSTEVAFASPTTKLSLFKKHLPDENNKSAKPTYGKHLGDLDRKWSDEESVAEEEDDITLDSASLEKKTDENINVKTSNQKAEDHKENKGYYLAKEIMAELNKSDLLTEYEAVVSTDTNKNNNDLVSKDFNQNIGDGLQRIKSNKKEENAQTDSVF